MEILNKHTVHAHILIGPCTSKLRCTSTQGATPVQRVCTSASWKMCEKWVYIRQRCGPVRAVKSP
jgi:hypothetical protein